MTPVQHAKAARRLDEAERTRRQIRIISREHAGMTMADACTVQGAWRVLRLERGERTFGHKIGLTSKAMQAAVGIDTPESGFLTQSMVFEDGGAVAVERFIGLRVEAELALVLKAPLSGADLTIEDLIAATDYVTRRWKFSTPASSASIRRRSARAPYSTRYQTTPPTSASCSADAGSIPAASTCAASARSSPKTARSTKRASPLACLAIPPRAS